MKDLRTKWLGDAEGWVVFAPVALTVGQLRRVATLVEPMQVDRYRSLPPGERKDECKRSIEALRAGRVRCIAQNREGVVFTSTERTQPERAIFIMGGLNNG